MAKSHENLIACAAAIAVASGGQLLARIRIMPFGIIKLRDGRGPFFLSKDRAQAVLAATLEYAGEQEIMVDYDHQSFYAVNPEAGGTAEASGWLSDFEIGDDGIYAKPDWTETAATKIHEKKYKYLSPLFAFDENKNVTRIQNAGLTNTPAIDGLTKLLAASYFTKPKNEENQMDLTKLAALVGLAANATLAEIEAAALKLKETLAAASSDLSEAKKALGLKDDAKSEEFVAAAANFKASTEDMVPAAFVKDLQTRLSALEGDKVEGIIAAAIEQGKITPAQKESSLEWARKDLVGFEKFIGAAAAFDGSKLPNSDPSKGASLTKEELAAASLAGVSAEEFLAEKAKLATNENMGA